MVLTNEHENIMPSQSTAYLPTHICVYSVITFKSKRVIGIFTLSQFYSTLSK